jgi:hypothetical protein
MYKYRAEEEKSSSKTQVDGITETGKSAFGIETRDGFQFTCYVVTKAVSRVPHTLPYTLSTSTYPSQFLVASLCIAFGKTTG